MKAFYLFLVAFGFATPLAAANGCRLRVSEIVRIAHHHQAGQCKYGCEVAIRAEAHIDGCFVIVSSGLDLQKESHVLIISNSGAVLDQKGET
jgi:hypothetical protein